MKNQKRTFCLLLLSVLWFCRPVPSNAAGTIEDDTKKANHFAVAALEGKETSQVSGFAGKAPFYLLFDENGVFLKSIENPGQAIRRNSSSVVLDLLVKESCKFVIAGKFGEKLQNLLKNHEIKYFEREGVANSVVQELVLAGKAAGQTE